MKSSIFQKHQIIAIDCDEVICDFSRYLLLKKLDGTPLCFEEIKNYNFSQNLGVQETNADFIELFKNTALEDENTLEISPILGAKEGWRKALDCI